jgi:peptidyl-prolyl cis-trans isomerase B (cyclophilin B)
MLRNLMLIASCAALVLPGCNGSKTDAPADAGQADKAPAPAKPADKAPAPSKTADKKPVAGPKPVAVMETSMGTITIELDPAKAPVTVKNFLRYVDDKFYDGTIFHRVMPTFMIQGGGFEPGMEQKETHDPIPNEAKNGLKNKRGTIAMARTSAPHSATAQFFINVVDNAGLDYPSRDGWGYCVFGKVIDGMDVADKIRAVETTTKGRFADVPVEDVIIKSVRLK